MGTSILQRFLDNQFIATDDLSHVEMLAKVSANLQRNLRQKKNRPNVVHFTLVALDPTISNENPIVGEVENLIVKQWPTFKNSVAKTRDTPIAYIQAVILDSLDKLSSDMEFAPIVWHAGCNIISHYRLGGQKSVLTAFLQDIGKRVEISARQSWGVSLEGSLNEIDQPHTKLPKTTAGHVDEEKLQKHLIAAVGQQSISGGENPQWPSHNAAHWPNFFAKRAAGGLSEEINAALSAQSDSIQAIVRSLETSIGSYLQQVNPYLDSVTKTVVRNTAAITQRSHLLWWKQALYSERLDVGYRSLDPLSASIAMAIDLAALVSPMYPRSVDYLLLEAAREAIGSKIDKKSPLRDLLEQLGKVSSDCKDLLESFKDASTHRRTFGACFRDFSKEGLDIEEFSAAVGIDTETKLSYGELLQWLFHDFHASTASFAS